MNVYPDTLRVILTYIEALDAADKKVEELGVDGAPYLLEIPITDGDGVNWGRLVDEIGGSWSWSVPEPPKRGEGA